MNHPDFSVMTDDQLRAYVLAHRQGNLCATSLRNGIVKSTYLEATGIASLHTAALCDT